MVEMIVRCPLCPPEIECDHDQEERRVLWAERGEEPQLEAAPGFNAGDETQVNRKANRARSAEKRADDDLLWIMQQAPGRRFIGQLLDRCGLHLSSLRPRFQGVAPDLITIAAWEGERAVALSLLADVQRVASHEYLMLLKERAETHA